MPSGGRTCDKTSIAKFPNPNKGKVKKEAKSVREEIKTAVNRKKGRRNGIRDVFLAVWLILVVKFFELWEKTHYQNGEKKVIILDEP